MALPSPPYPVNLLVEGRSVLVVGGGYVALEKVEGLLDARADITLVAPEIVAELTALADEGRLRIEPRPYRRGEAAEHRLVIVATSDPAVNAQVAAEADAAGCGSTPPTTSPTAPSRCPPGCAGATCC